MIRNEHFSETEIFIEKLKEIAPTVFTEGKVNMDKLRLLLGEHLDGASEKFGLQWHGKMKSIRSVQKNSEGTLRPVSPKSVYTDKARNILIEGDNLEVLKQLQKSYYSKVKMIFIDPPYNTGNDFVYPDNYSEPLESYLRYTGQIDKEGILRSDEVEKVGRKHSNWLNMIYPRLYLARNLLKDDGVIFVSIDDNEYSRLKLILDEIFGEENFVANIVWKHTQQSKNDEPYFSRHHNSILVYRKSEKLSQIRLKRTDEDNKAYSNPDNDPKGMWRSGDVRSPSLRNTLKFKIHTPSGKIIEPPENGWRWKKETIDEKINTKEIIFNEDETKIIRKIYLSDQEGRTPENIFMPEVAGTTREATNQLKQLFNGVSPFDTPKPTKLIKRLIEMITSPTDLILDFFAGSGTTGHAVMELNKEDEGNRKYILVQLPEPISDEQFETVADVTRERVIRAAAALEVDPSFKYFKLDTSNFHKWNHNALTPEQLSEQMEAWRYPIKEDRSADDVLYEVLLKGGFELTANIEKYDVDCSHFFMVQQDDQKIIVYVCREKLSEDVLYKMKKVNPSQVWILDEAFDTDDEKKNIELQWKEEGIAFRTI